MPIPDKTMIEIEKAIPLSGIYSTLIGAILLFGLPKVFLNLFSATEEMLIIGIPAMRIMSLSFLFAGIGIMVSYAFQGLGKGVASLIISALRQCVVLLPVAWILCKFINVDGVWWSFLIAEAVTAIISLIWLHIENRQLKRSFSDSVSDRNPDTAKNN